MIRTKNDYKKFLTMIFHRKFKKISLKLGFSIAENTCDRGLVIPHYGTIVVGPNNHIEKYCVLHTSTCITASDTQRTIGNGFYLSKNSVVAKCESIADFVTVSSCSFVNKNIINKNILIAGAPAKEIKTCAPWYESSEKYNSRYELCESIL